MVTQATQSWMQLHGTEPLPQFHSTAEWTEWVIRERHAAEDRIAEQTALQKRRSTPVKENKVSLASRSTIGFVLHFQFALFPAGPANSDRAGAVQRADGFEPLPPAVSMPADGQLSALRRDLVHDNYATED